MKKVIKLGGCTVAVEVLNKAIGVTVAKSVFVFTEPVTPAQAMELGEALVQAANVGFAEGMAGNGGQDA